VSEVRRFPDLDGFSRAAAVEFVELVHDEAPGCGRLVWLVEQAAVAKLQPVR
jgi:hypothetical protein